MQPQKSLGPNLVSAQVDWQIGIELRVCICASVLHVDRSHPNGELLVEHMELLTTHLKTDSIMLVETNNGLIQLKGAYELHHQLPIGSLIYTKELIPFPH